MKKLKHDHKGTKALKLTIFFSLMLAPILAVLFKCAYVTFNKNAYQSYGGEIQAKYETNNITSLDDIVNGNIYTFTIESNQATSTTTLFQAKAFYNVPQNSTYDNKIDLVSNDDSTYYIFRATTTGYLVQNSNYGSVLSLSNSSITYPISFDFVMYNKSQINTTLLTYENFSKTDFNIYENQYNAQSTLDNAFYYAIDEMKNNDLFNWTTNTALYTPTAAMTNGMGITTTALPILITYWLYLTAIYIVIDIVVELFTYLTHMITSKLDT